MKYILVADDEPTNQILLEEILMDAYEVLVVADGVECMGSIAQRIPDLLLLDVSMPRMNGLDVCHALRKNDTTKNIPILILSASATSEDINKGLDVGADGYVTKPFSPKKLLADIEAIIGH